MPRPRFTFFTLCVLAPLAACGHSDATAPATKPQIDVYPLRGTIEALPTGAAPHTLTIRHEATADMPSMTMPFTVDAAVSLTGLAVGDKVSFRYEIDWSQRLEHVTKIEKLPADTILNFGPAASTAGKPAGG